MSKIKFYIQAARLRTLPLSVSGIIVGAGMAYSENKFNLTIFILSILTTIGFQVLSNFANDYGDGIRGTDDNREGELRLIAAGLISPKQMKNAIIITIIITFLCVTALIFESFGKSNIIKSLVFFLLGVASILAAIKYTVGKSAYGYSGLGDVFVFLFFGILGVLGSYYLYTHNIDNLWLILPASAFGMLSASVLNLNNMRDQIQDEKANKNTLVVKLGSKKAKIYHYGLIIGSLLLLSIFRIKQDTLSYNFWIFLIAFIPLFFNLKVISKNKKFSELDSELKKVALATFICSILFSVAYFF
jgi:1,4-dihydroxy-2-naphthoate octaprenyltransferase